MDECGAPEFFTGGAKLITIDGLNGKFSAEDLRKNITNHLQILKVGKF